MHAKPWILGMLLHDRQPEVVSPEKEITNFKGSYPTKLFFFKKKKEGMKRKTPRAVCAIAATPWW